MKKLLISTALLASAFSAGAAPLVTIGDQLDLFFRGAVIGSWDSNILNARGGPTKWDDYMATIRLGAEADYGRHSKFKANIKFYEDINRYLDHNEFNSELANVFATASYTETVFTVDANFSFQQLRQNSATIGYGLPDIVRRDAYNAGINGSYEFSEKLFGEVGFSWYAEKFVDYTDIYSDQDVYSIPVSLLYRLSPKISVGLSYQFRYSEFTGGSSNLPNRYDNFGGVTLRGEIAPKLTTVIYAGIQSRTYDGSGMDDNMNFAFSARFDYAVTDKITTFVKGFRDFANGASRQSSTNTGMEMGATYAISPFVKAVGSFAYTNADYYGSNREDDTFVPRIGVFYTPNKYISLGANYRYLDNSSNVNPYMGHNVSLDFTVRY